MKAGRTAAQGLIFTGVSADNKVAVILEFNSETDFVAKNPEFVEFGNTLVKIALENNITDVEALKAAKNGDATVEEGITGLIAKIGENINVRRFVRYGLGEGLEKRNDDFVAEVMASVGQ